MLIIFEAKVVEAIQNKKRSRSRNREGKKNRKQSNTR